jgi:hypothetical protein
MASRSDDWTLPQVEAVVADYLAMLTAEWAGKPFNKAEHNRALQAITGRSHGSIEKKHQNISAILHKVGIPPIDGYKPLPHGQGLLESVVLDRVQADEGGILTAAERLIAGKIAPAAMPQSFDEILVQAPTPEPADQGGDSFPPTKRPPRIRNYAEIDAKNRLLGKAGEEFALELEQRRLWDAGRQDLSTRVEHVAATRGDGLGYDVESFEVNGTSRLIEVKTTSFGARTPFFLSQHEVTASDRLAATYRLYRVFHFRVSPRLFMLKGSVRSSCQLVPDRYVARAGGSR